MEEKIEKSNPFIYLPLFALSAALVFWAFASFFKLGREEAKKEPPRPVSEQAQAAAVDMSLLYSPTPELVAEGKMLFAVNCASCHGPAGKGDGDRAPELNPRPRNFTAEKFKFGNAPSQLWNTLRVGSPGTAMASFELLRVSDRMAIIHYIRTLIPNPANDSPEVVAQLSGGGTASSGGAATTAAADTAKAGPRIPIVLALRASARPEGPVGRKLSRLPSGLGKEIYIQRCASCHDASGEGGEPVQKLAVFPYRYAKAPTLQNPNAAWLKDKKEFEKVVVGGLPGKMMPGELLTEPHLDALYRFVVELAKER